jgi:hypothetical protein
LEEKPAQQRPLAFGHALYDSFFSLVPDFDDGLEQSTTVTGEVNVGYSSIRSVWSSLNHSVAL